VLAELAEADLDTPRKTNWGELWPCHKIFTTVINEQVHHGAEISLLRALYRNRQTLGSQHPERHGSASQAGRDTWWRPRPLITPPATRRPMRPRARSGKKGLCPDRHHRSAPRLAVRQPRGHLHCRSPAHPATDQPDQGVRCGTGSIPLPPQPLTPPGVTQQDRALAHVPSLSDLPWARRAISSSVWLAQDAAPAAVCPRRSPRSVSLRTTPPGPSRPCITAARRAFSLTCSITERDAADQRWSTPAVDSVWRDCPRGRRRGEVPVDAANQRPGRRWRDSA
jgi:hypothetical protein